MSALVVVETYFGNTRHIADVVANGLRSDGIDTEVVAVQDAPTQLEDGIELLAVDEQIEGLLGRCHLGDAVVRPENADQGPTTVAIVVDNQDARNVHVLTNGRRRCSFRVNATAGPR